MINLFLIHIIKTMKSLFKYLWRFLLFPAIVLFASMVVVVVVWVKEPIAMIWMLIGAIGGIFGWGIFALTKKRLVVGVLRILLAFVFARMRWWEPYLTQVQTHELPLWFSGNFVVLSDLHVWPYKWQKFVRWLVDKINKQENIDAVFIVGDWVYEPESGTVATILSPLKDIRFPIYGVLGNHDEETSYRWQNIKEEVIAAIKALWIPLLQNQEIQIPISATWKNDLSVRLFGLWDERAWGANVTILSWIKQEDNVIVLAHNPDTIMRYGLTGFDGEKGTYDRNFFRKLDYVTWRLENVPVDLTIAWHTHAAQIRLAWLTTRMIPTKYRRPNDGRYDDFNLFISRWVGETILPMRLFNRATIYVLRGK